MRKVGFWGHVKKDMWPYLFISLFFIFYFGFHLYPQLYSFYLSLHDFRIGRPSTFVGLQNFTTVLGDPIFWFALGNTFIFWLGTLPVQIVLAFLIATIMVNVIASTRLRGLLSGFYYLPVVTNLVAVIMIFQLMYDESFGVLNYFLSIVGIEGIPWLTNPIVAKLSTMLLIIWRGLGYYIVLTLAGLMSVDKSLYEYAQTEGANYFQKQLYITIPMIKPILLFQLFTGTIAGWNIFLEPFLLFSRNVGPWPAFGGPGGTGLTAAMYIYTEAFQNMRFGSGAAMSLILAAITTVFALLQFKVIGTGEVK